ncbi:DNA gyrase subunit A [candidate division TA06 bacterium DG_26]|uniref:DNA gyrase subunit A n=1 Tax=candidate division TA06 bacterium DG_26 TaxID=1703771 RepID=A0A0S7WKI7_UNCT6|nr:MAG: DNA gyrase subunit A [candidate division TA06 bacterium DG_26]
MEESGERIIQVYIEDEMKSSYLDYAMSVVVGRALPSVRDGMKPVHRRILYAMREAGLTHNRPYKKSATVVGDVLGKYHPHGDTAVYDALVRMVQDFSLRYPLVDGQGNFGSIDGDAAAAYRYTEVRLTEIAEEMLTDIEKDTVDWVPNFDGRLKEPTVLPSKFPNLIVNGSSGIAVGMATNIPPHNLGEVIDALCALIDNPDLNAKDLMEYIPGPDLPTGGIIVGKQGAREAYLTGKGKIVIRAKVRFETTGNRTSIVVTEIPYQVNKATLIERIAHDVREKRVDGIASLRDESDRNGIRIVMELKRDAQKEVVLNQLFKHTQLRTSFGIILLTLVNRIPRVLNLEELLEEFVAHRKMIVERRTKFELKQAEERAHIVEGLRIAVENIDEVVSIIKGSKDPETAKKKLMKRFGFSEIQAKAILDMRLQRLTSLEREKLQAEYLELIKLIAKLKAILESEVMIKNVIKEELHEMKSRFADPRRTVILEEEEQELETEDLIAEEDMVVTLTHRGYIKRLPLDAYRRQHKGGKGSVGVQTSEEDFASSLFIGGTHDQILFFTTQGRCYSLKVHEIPEAGRLSKGKSISNLFPIDSKERVSCIVPIKSFGPSQSLVLATRAGIVKRLSLNAFSNLRRSGIIAAKLPESDSLVEVKLLSGDADILLASAKGLGVRFKHSQLREMGRNAYGVKGIRLTPGDSLLGMVVLKEGETLFLATERGYGKRVDFGLIRPVRRGCKGVKLLNTDKKSGDLVVAMAVSEDDELILISTAGQVIRICADKVSQLGRQARGVKLMSLEVDDTVSDVARVLTEDQS